MSFDACDSSCEQYVGCKEDDYHEYPDDDVHGFVGGVEYARHIVQIINRLLEGFLDGQRVTAQKPEYNQNLCYAEHYGENATYRSNCRIKTL